MQEEYTFKGKVHEELKRQDPIAQKILRMENSRNLKQKVLLVFPGSLDIHLSPLLETEHWTRWTLHSNPCESSHVLTNNPFQNHVNY